MVALLKPITNHAIYELHECTRCGAFFDPEAADYDTGPDDPVCDSCVIALYPDMYQDADYMRFVSGIALF